MVRERMVTRTVTISEVTALTVNLTTCEAQSHDFTLAGVANLNQAQLLKYLQSGFDSDVVKVVAITQVSTREELYGMPEQEFIAKARPMPPRTAEN